MLKHQVVSIALLFLPASLLAADPSFELDSNYTVGFQPLSVVAVDLNNDGWSDVATANYDDNQVSVLLNKGDGTFSPQVKYGAYAGQTSICAGDFNHDNRMDLAVGVSYDPDNTNRVYILLNQGNGTFSPGTPYSSLPGMPPRAVYAADLDLDGDVDIAAAAGAYNKVLVFKNNGNGTFQVPPPSYDVWPNDISVIIVELTGDGWPDIATANLTDNSLSILENNAVGGFLPFYGYNTGSSPYQIIASDIDRDGDNDLAVVYTEGGVSILRNNGLGSFFPRTDYTGGSKPMALCAADFNNDSFPDIALADNIGNNVIILKNNGNATFQKLQTEFPAGTEPHSIFAADFNQDGNQDLVVANQSSNNISILMNNTCVASKGDMNGDTALTPADVVLLLNCVFLATGNCTSGSLCFTDLNCDGSLSPADVVILLNMVFLAAPVGC